MKRILFLPVLSVFFLIGAGCQQVVPISEENTQAERLAFKGLGFILPQKPPAKPVSFLF